MPNMIFDSFCTDEVIFTALQPNKTIKIFTNYFLGPLLFGWLLYSIWHQLQAQQGLHASWKEVKQSMGSAVPVLTSVVLLMLANWGIEAAKWQLAVAAVHPVRWGTAFKAVLAGVAFSVTMPNRIGEYAGRIMYLPEGVRLKSVAVTVVGSISQLLITLVCGAAGFLFLGKALLASGMLSEVWYRVVLFGTVGVIAVVGLLYFAAGSIGGGLERWFTTSRYLYLVQSLKRMDTNILLLLLVLSFLRYLIFIVQYFLLFSFFGVEASFWQVSCVVSTMFLAMAALPTVALAELGFKGEISLQLMSLFTQNGLGVVLASASVWAINLMLPALLGCLLILSIRVFNKKNETV